MPYFAVDDDFGWVQLKVVELPEHLTYLGARNNFPHFWKKNKKPPENPSVWFDFAFTSY